MSFFNNFSTLLSDLGYTIAISTAIFGFIVLITTKKLQKRLVIITAVCMIFVGLVLAIGAKSLPNLDKQTIVPSVTATATTIIPVSTFTATVTAVPSATPTHSNPTATPTLGVTPIPRLSPTPRLTPTHPIQTPVVTPMPICQAPCDAEFPDTGVPFTIYGPAIVEWADPGCGIYELNAGNSFTWSSDGHYWLYPDQNSLDSFWPGHLQTYQSNPAHSSCIEGPPPK